MARFAAADLDLFPPPVKEEVEVVLGGCRRAEFYRSDIDMVQFDRSVFHFFFIFHRFILLQRLNAKNEDQI